MNAGGPTGLERGRSEIKDPFTSGEDSPGVLVKKPKRHSTERYLIRRVDGSRTGRRPSTVRRTNHGDSTRRFCDPRGEGRRRGGSEGHRTGLKREGDTFRQRRSGRRDRIE